ncbi:MAG: THxN family PEP-CTERM protein [Pseudomonadota bacterium]
MKLKTLQKALSIGIVVISSTYAIQATAAPIFSFTEYGGFEGGMVPVADYSNPIVGAPSVVPAETPLYSTMSWNTGTLPQSSLVLDTVEGPSALAADTWTRISTLTHNNVLIRNAADWGPQNIHGRFIVTDSDGGPSVVEDDDSAIAINLTETTNSSPCAFPTPNGSTCDDFFKFTAVGLQDLFFTANDGSSWTASFRFANLQNAFFDEATSTVYTAEGTTSSLDVEVLLTQTSSVPEPATLGILGLGLLGLGMAKRRKQNG